MLSRSASRLAKRHVLSPALTISLRGFRSDYAGVDMWRVADPDAFYHKRLREYTKPKQSPIKIAVTGAAGNIGYSGILFRLASGEILGPDQPVILHCLEVPQALPALKGVAMELDDCAFPLLRDVVCTDDPARAFEDIDYALLIGAKPRGPGMERKDLLLDNGHIFAATGKALNKHAKKSCKTIVVGNPANTNCLIAAHNAPDIPPENFSAMTRLDHDRAKAQVSLATGVFVGDIHYMAIWGNHSSTQFPDCTSAIAHSAPVTELLGELDFDDWNLNTFIPTVAKRGAAVIEARGSSSAASAGNACLMHLRDWHIGSDKDWVSMAVRTDTELYPEFPEGLYFSVPVICEDGSYKIVDSSNVKLWGSPLHEKYLEATIKELKEERDAVAALLKD